MKKYFVLILYLLSFPIITDAFSHQPRIVIKEPSSEVNPILIREPEVSKAYYGQIEKSAEYYKIYSDREFTLYASLEIPEIPEQSKNIVLELKDQSGLQLAYLAGQQHHWRQFHEDFGNADYLSGPSIQMILPSGDYTITVNGEENTKYVLVTGQKEEFPPEEFLKSLFLVPQINQEFFAMNIFQSIINIFGFTLLIIFSAIGFTILFLVKRLHKMQSHRLEE